MTEIMNRAIYVTIFLFALTISMISSQISLSLNELIESREAFAQPNTVATLALFTPLTAGFSKQIEEGLQPIVEGMQAAMD
jgi:hypothetical protein